MFAEINEETYFKLRCFEIVLNLRPMLIIECFDGFDFHDDLGIENEVRFVFLSEKLAFVINWQLGFGLERKTSILEFSF